MKAIVTHGPFDYRLETVPDPVPGPEEVVIRVKASGLCASDMKCYHGGPSFWQGNPPYVKPPVIPGHEFIGEVVALGEGAEEKYGLRIGDKAVAEQILPCWECRFCKTGKYWMCERNYVFGFQGGIDDGGMAEYSKFPKGSI
ncbi:MAG TPA: alcohol dehydrogenase catalytic domain-containing protein, partial [bacterium]|nr:alcohol dehydrogenase catalytic domain-containing protein [bacterium]